MGVVGFWLAQQPLWLSGLFVIGGGMLAAAIGVAIVYALSADADLAQNVNVGSAKFQFLSQIYAVFLGLMLVALYQQYLDDHKLVLKEVSALSSLEEIAGVLRPDDRLRVQTTVRAYAHAVATEEWPLLDLGAASPETERRFQAINQAILAIDPASLREMVLLQGLTGTWFDLKTSRVARVTEVPRPLNRLIWFVLLLSTGVSISFFWFFGDADMRSRILFSSLLTAVIMSEVLAILVLTYPFTGDIAISPEPFVALAEAPAAAPPAAVAPPLPGAPL